MLIYERHLNETIKLIREAIKSHDAHLKEQIIKRVELYATDKEFKKFIISATYLAHKLLDALYDYIKMRHLELEETFRTNLIKIFAPPSISKLLFIAAENKKFYTKAPPGIIGVTIDTLKNSISNLRTIRFSIPSEKKVDESIFIRDEYLQLMLEKKTIREKITNEVIKEIRESGTLNLESILKNNGRISGLLEYKLRLNSILRLIINEFIEIFYDKSGKISLRVKKNGERK